MTTETVNSLSTPPTDEPNAAEQEAAPEQAAANVDTSDAPAPAETPTSDAPTEEQVQALAGALAQTAQQHAHAHVAEKRQDSDDIFSGPYDPEQAVQAMTDANREVIAAKAQLDASVARTKEFRKTHEEAVGRMSRICSRFDQLRKRSDDPQPFLKPVDEALRNGANEMIHERRERLAGSLVERSCFVDEAGLRGLTRQDLETLERWVEQAGPVPPELVAQKAHIAGEAGTDGTYCTRCKLWLGRREDASDYPAGAFVRLDCLGTDTVTATDAVARARRKHEDTLAPGASTSATVDGQQRTVRGKKSKRR